MLHLCNSAPVSGMCGATVNAHQGAGVGREELSSGKGGSQGRGCCVLLTPDTSLWPGCHDTTEEVSSQAHHTSTYFHSAVLRVVLAVPVPVIGCDIAQPGVTAVGTCTIEVGMQHAPASVARWSLSCLSSCGAGRSFVQCSLSITSGPVTLKSAPYRAFAL
jgi:hypothetical protein